MSRPAISRNSAVSQLNCGGRVLDLRRVAVMGILNTTPDSFSDGGQFTNLASAIRHAEGMVDDGADIVDVGGESTRPGAAPVSVQEEIDRVIPVIAALCDALGVPISVDTSKPEVMREAISAGAGMVNDVYALRAQGALDEAARSRVAVCLMHMQGEPRTMQDNPQYVDVVREVRAFLAERYAACIAAGISGERIVVDPGFGFGKSVAHNMALLRGLRGITVHGAPVLVGLSRKSLIGKTLGRSVSHRDAASVALALSAVQNGAQILRVHDVGATRDAVRMWEAVHPADPL
ncbi:MAG: dihydropteroate synthase [Gammaproteobacteria bacterium]|nr:dihydropteroate synthase [Gammaproteobacteria bacterium]